MFSRKAEWEIKTEDQLNKIMTKHKDMEEQCKGTAQEF